MGALAQQLGVGALAAATMATLAALAAGEDPGRLLTAADRSTEGRRGRIAAVVDGDTVKVDLGRRRVTVRASGIDTPETKRPGRPVECGGPQATSAMYALAFTAPRDTDGDGLYDRPGGRGRAVTLERDPTQDRRDRYGRELAYLRLDDGRLIQTEQLRSGWANVYVYAGRRFSHQAEFERAATDARDARRGAWSLCGDELHGPAR